jgi:hypothetical protein
METQWSPFSLLLHNNGDTVVTIFFVSVFKEFYQDLAAAVVIFGCSI